MLELGFDPGGPSGPRQRAGTRCTVPRGKGRRIASPAILRHPAGRQLLAVRDATYQGPPLGWCLHGSVNRRNPRGDYVAVARLLLHAGARVDDDVEGRDASDEVREVIDQRGQTP